MCVALIGGMERLEGHYVREAEKLGVSLRVFNCSGARMKPKVENADGVVVFTNNVSHCAKGLASLCSLKTAEGVDRGRVTPAIPRPMERPD